MHIYIYVCMYVSAHFTALYVYNHVCTCMYISILYIYMHIVAVKPLPKVPKIRALIRRRQEIRHQASTCAPSGFPKIRGLHVAPILGGLLERSLEVDFELI